MDRIQETSFVITQLNSFFDEQIKDYELIDTICTFFDTIKEDELTPSDLKFLKYISNICGVPHYYDLLFSKFGHNVNFNHYDLNSFSSILYESTLHIDINIKIHKFQKSILNKFNINNTNRYFLSATTSFGKTFLIYEIIKRMQYKNIVLVFPTIALLSENYERLLTDGNYDYFYNEFMIHTLSEFDIDKIGRKNIFIFTPERYLSFIDKNRKLDIDFVFVDEIYKIDNEYLTNTINKENERDTAYRVALFHILKSTHDILLVGPYIEFPDTNEDTTNQSFNLFLYNNNFTILDFNKYEIVNKSVNIVKNGITKIDKNLTINLKRCKSVGEKLGKIVSDIRQIEENCIIYTKGAGTAEQKAKDIIKFSNVSNALIHKDLQQLITHLKRTFQLEDWSLIRGLENKIGIHHGLVPKYIQKEIIHLFNEGNLDVLISTTTITEGVNTSAKNLIVQSASKGNKPLKTFDAKNIAGRAGRFLHHYHGRVLIIDKKFKDILEGSDSEIKHKNYDESSQKDEIDYFITDEDFLSSDDRKNRKLILSEQRKRNIPNEIMQMYKVISHSDKITVYDEIIMLSNKDFLKIKRFIQKISYLSLYKDGFSVILKTIYPIINNRNLLFFIDTESQIRRGKNIGKIYPILTYMLSSYLSGGFMGSVQYNLSRQKRTSNGMRNLTTDEAIRDSSTFIFHHCCPVKKLITNRYGPKSSYCV